jgi:hypothetical protein
MVPHSMQNMRVLWAVEREYLPNRSGLQYNPFLTRKRNDEPQLPSVRHNPLPFDLVIHNPFWSSETPKPSSIYASRYKGNRLSMLRSTAHTRVPAWGLLLLLQLRLAAG